MLAGVLLAGGLSGKQRCMSFESLWFHDSLIPTGFFKLCLFRFSTAYLFDGCQWDSSKMSSHQGCWELFAASWHRFSGSLHGWGFLDRTWSVNKCFGLKDRASRIIIHIKQPKKKDIQRICNWRNMKFRYWELENWTNYLYSSQFIPILYPFHLFDPTFYWNPEAELWQEVKEVLVAELTNSGQGGFGMNTLRRCL